MFSEIDEYIDYAALSEMEPEEKALYLDGLAEMSLDLASTRGKENVAYELLSFCVNEGCSKAAKYVVKLFDEGVSSIDKASAEKFCAIAAFAGDSECKDRLKKSFETSPELESLLKRTDAASRYELYNHYLKEGDTVKAEKYFSEALEMGDKDALFETYVSLSDKNSSYHNVDLAIYYLEEAARAGHEEAKKILKEKNSI